MTKGLKFFLMLIGVSYFFALGMWAAKGYELYSRHQRLKETIKEMNVLSSEYKENLLVLSEKLNQKKEYQSLAKHIKALAQITPNYTLENSLIKNEEHQNLEYFVDGILMIIVRDIPDYPAEETVLFQEHIQELKKKRMELKSALIIP